MYAVSNLLNLDALHGVILRITGKDIDLCLDDAFQPLETALPWQLSNQAKAELAERHLDAVQAAFATGVMVGAHPDRYLLERLSECAGRLERCADNLDGAQ